MTTWWQGNQGGRAAQNREGAGRKPTVAPCDLEDGGGSSCSSGDGGNDSINRLGTGKNSQNILRNVQVAGAEVPSQLGFCGPSSRSVTAAAAALSVANGDDDRATSSRTVVGAAAALAANSGGLPELFRSARANSAATSAGTGRSGISSSHGGYSAATEVGVESVGGTRQEKMCVCVCTAAYLAFPLCIDTTAVTYKEYCSGWCFGILPLGACSLATALFGMGRVRVGWRFDVDFYQREGGRRQASICP